MLATSFARSHDLPVVILRPFNTFGPRQSERAVIPTIMRQALDPEVAAIHVGDVTPIRDFTFVEDTAAAFLAIGAGTKIEFGVPYNAGTGRGVSVGDVIALVRKLAQCDKPLEQDKGRLRPPRSEVHELLADWSRLSTATGWRPKTELSDGLERTLAWVAWPPRRGAGSPRKRLCNMTARHLRIRAFSCVPGRGRGLAWALVATLAASPLAAAEAGDYRLQP
jgi:nucleoside-diphosphate-sugar epimerase